MKVQIAHQRIADGQQQPISGRERGRQAAGCHQTGNHIRQTANLGHGQHDEVGPQANFTELHNAIAVHILHREQRRIHPRPLRHPVGQLVKAAAHQVVHHLILHQCGQRRGTQVQQGNEKQRPGHRSPRPGHSGRGVVAREQVRQTGCANHEAKHQRQEVAPGVVKVFALLRRAVGITRKRLAVARQSAQGASALVVVVHLARPALTRLCLVTRQGGQLAAGSHNQTHVGIAGPQLLHTLARTLALARQGGLHVVQALFVLLRARQIGLHHFTLGLRGQQLLFQLGDMGNLLAVSQRGQGGAQLLVGQPGHGYQKGQQQHHILRDLSPGDGTHPPQK